MPINTISVAAAVTPTVIHTYLSHYLNRGPLRQKPTAHITYHEGLELIRRFLRYTSFHTVEDIQAFTSQWVPVPAWVSVEAVEIPAACLAKSAAHIQAQLKPEGLKQVGGAAWWQWRRDDAPLQAEWVEMRKDQYERSKKSDEKGKRGERIILYVHGGAYYFGSVDEHRYQIQRHARKLKARVLAPRYRLAPQFPFPCGLMDCLAAYLYLLENGYPPSTILLAGDSAGGGMVLSMLVILRDQGVPLPAGAILISPWVDLTHSFPSLGGDGKLDYIPAHGFVHKPSMDWPPPNAYDLVDLERGRKPVPEADPDRVRGFSVTTPAQPPRPEDAGPEEAAPEYVAEDGKYTIGPLSTLSVFLDGKLVEIKDQIQLYAPNHLLMHPLVSPALQPSLGGLPPLLIQAGGGELLRDEQIYIAHKAASPLAYLPRSSNHVTQEQIHAESLKYRPTNVQLQVWDDLCHVAPTLSFTRPAKYMYRSIAQFGAWALARAQKKPIDILDDDDVSVISTTSSSSSISHTNNELSSDAIKLNMPDSAQRVVFEPVHKKESKGPAVGKAGDPLPPFTDHMIRQRIDRHGTIHDLSSPSEIPALVLPSSEIGVPKRGPLEKWMHAQTEWNQKFAKEKIKVQKKRVEYMAMGYEGFEGEHPPPTALAGRRLKGAGPEKKKKKSWGMSLWSLWGSEHDKKTILREEEADAGTEQKSDETAEPSGSVPQDSHGNERSHRDKPRFLRTGTQPHSRSRSRHSAVTDEGQAKASTDDVSHIPAQNSLSAPSSTVPATGKESDRKASPLPSPISGIATPSIVIEDSDRPTSPLDTVIPATNTLSTRPTRSGVAYPFRLKVSEGGRDVNASTVTLQSVNLGDDNGDDGEEHRGESQTTEEESVQKSAERPAPERFVTADSGAIRSANQGEESGPLERPGVERFETAQEVLLSVEEAGRSKDS